MAAMHDERPGRHPVTHRAARAAAFVDRGIVGLHASPRLERVRSSMPRAMRSSLFARFM
ncbi:hypothetical protein BURPS668_A1445 [Burkholderia pseudomallei 668]|nr:hypothetical protein BURPS668_A1445 [Burkholderia pseudomallei 668]